jgi:hypothetical protein
MVLLRWWENGDEVRATKEGTRGSGSCRLGSSCWSRGVKMENGLMVSAVLVLSMRLAVESFMSMKSTGSGGRLRAASFPCGTGRKWE